MFAPARHLQRLARLHDRAELLHPPFAVNECPRGFRRCHRRQQDIGPLDRFTRDIVHDDQDFEARQGGLDPGRVGILMERVALQADQPPDFAIQDAIENCLEAGSLAGQHRGPVTVRPRQMHICTRFAGVGFGQIDQLVDPLGLQQIAAADQYRASGLLQLLLNALEEQGLLTIQPGQALFF